MKAELTSICVGNLLVCVCVCVCACVCVWCIYKARRIQATLSVSWYQGGKKYWMTMCVCVEKKEPPEIRK